MLAGQLAGSDEPLTGGLAAAYSGRDGMQGARRARSTSSSLEPRAPARPTSTRRRSASSSSSAPVVRIALFDRDRRQDRVAHGEDRGDLEVGVDAIADAARCLRSRGSRAPRSRLPRRPRRGPWRRCRSADPRGRGTGCADYADVARFEGMPVDRPRARATSPARGATMQAASTAIRRSPACRRRRRGRRLPPAPRRRRRTSRVRSSKSARTPSVDREHHGSVGWRRNPSAAVR